MRRIITLTLVLVLSFSADAGKWEWTTETCDRQYTEFMKCRCRPNASGPTCSDVEPVADDCSVRVSSLGFEDHGCDGDHREDCAVLTVYRESIGTFQEYRLVTSDPSSGVRRGIIVTTFDPQSCSVGDAETFDIYYSSSRADAFRNHVEALPEGTIVIVMTSDEYTKHLQSNEALLVEMGSPQEVHHAHRSSLSIITRRSSDGWCPLASEYQAPGQGPAVVSMGAQGMAEPHCINEEHKAYKKQSKLYKKYLKFLPF